MKRWTAAFVLLAVFILGAPGSATSKFFSASIQKFRVPVDAYNFTLPDLEGKKITLSVFKGQVVILNFFTTD